MPNDLSSGLLIFLCVALLFAFQSTSEAADRLLSGFLRPPQVAKPQTWWHWCNGSVTFEGITKDLEELAEKGVAGVQIFNVAPGNPPGPILFMSPQWHELFKHAVKEANRLRLGGLRSQLRRLVKQWRSLDKAGIRYAKAHLERGPS
jgi:hypothetical protein